MGERENEGLLEKTAIFLPSPPTPRTVIDTVGGNLHWFEILGIASPVW